MKRPYTLVLFFWVLLFANQAMAQKDRTAPFSIKGKLIDQDTKEPLGFATVRVFEKKGNSLVAGVTTGMDGKFNIKVPAGKYALQADFVGYQSKTISEIEITAQSGSIELENILMAEDSEVLEEVEVTAQKAAVEYNLDKRIYNVSESVTNAGGTANQVLDNLPSVEVDPVEGTVSLRGSQNVRIMIDGKPSALSGITTVDALRTLQGNMIDKVEVVTNPSAKYEAEGEAGIINIVLKKNRKTGINGSFDFNVGYPDNHGTAFNLNFRREKVNFFGSYGVNYRNAPGGGETVQRFFTPQLFDSASNATFTMSDIDRDHEREDLSQRLRVGMDFFLTKTVTLTGAINYNYDVGDNKTTTRYSDYNSDGLLVSERLREGVEAETSDNISTAFNFKKTFERKDQELTFDFSWSDNEDLEEADFLDVTRIDPTGDSADIEQRSTNTEDQENWLVQADYVHPFAEKARFETGFRGTHRQIDNDFIVEERQVDESEFVSLGGDLENDVTYKEDIWAYYATVGNETGKIAWQLGLRGEYTYISTLLARTDEFNSQEYFNLFPSAALSYKFTKEKSLQLSYSRRLSRPRFRSLLPFSNFNDPRNLRIGNPALRPEFTHSVEAGYLQNWSKGSLLTSVYYRYRTQVTQRITTVNEQGQNITQPVNLGTQDAVGLEFSFSLDLAPWWSVNTNANLYNEVTNGSFQGEDLSAEATTLNARGTTRFKLPEKINLQATYRYTAPRNTPQGRRNAVSVVDLGASKEVFKGKGTLSLAVQDLFNTRFWRWETRLPNSELEGEFQWRERQITLSLNYRLNQKKPRGRRGGRGGYGGGGGDGF